MKAVLFLTPQLPLPATQGAPMRNLSMIRAAAQRTVVDLLAFSAAPPDAAVESALSQLCRRWDALPPPRRDPQRRLAVMARSPLPDMADRLWSPDFDEKLADWLTTEEYAAVQVEGIEMARYALDGKMGERLIFDDHNVEHLLQRRASQTDRWDPLKWPAVVYSMAQVSRLGRFEAKICSRADAVIAVSEEDALALSSLAPNLRPDVIPNAIDISAYPFRQVPDDARPVVLFPATMDFRPNAEASLWLIDRVLPILKLSFPNVQCFIAGRNPTPALVWRCQHDPAVAVTGEVVSMAPYWERTTVCVLPLQVSGGSRFKALEAMALGVPVVSTRRGMEGIDALPGRDYLLADQPAAFSAAIARVFDDAELRRSLAKHARDLVERNHHQSIVSERLGRLYERLL